MKYRKKPVVINAVQVPSDPSNVSGHGEVWGLFYSSSFKDFTVTADKGYDIRTLEGVMHASPGDWIIKGVAGELYTCKPDIFEKTHERVE
jgi:hypothetical protein